MGTGERGACETAQLQGTLGSSAHSGTGSIRHVGLDFLGFPSDSEVAVITM